MQCDTCRWLEQFPIDRRENANVVVGSGGGANNASVLIDSLEELTDDERHRLDAFHFLLRVQIFFLEIALLVFDVFFLDFEELELTLEFLQNGDVECDER